MSFREFPTVGRELLAVEMTTTVTTTSTAADGASLSTPFAGSFEVATSRDVEILIHMPSLAKDTTDWVGFIAWLDGATNLGVRYYWPWLANVPLGGMTGIWRVSGLSLGTHTIEARGKVGGAGTGTFAMTSTDKGLIIVREVV